MNKTHLTSTVNKHAHEAQGTKPTRTVNPHKLKPKVIQLTPPVREKTKTKKVNNSVSQQIRDYYDKDPAGFNPEECAEALGTRVARAKNISRMHIQKLKTEL